MNTARSSLVSQVIQPAACFSINSGQAACQEDAEDHDSKSLERLQSKHVLKPREATRLPGQDTGKDRLARTTELVTVLVGIAAKKIPSTQRIANVKLDTDTVFRRFMDLDLSFQRTGDTGLLSFQSVVMLVRLVVKLASNSTRDAVQLLLNLFDAASLSEIRAAAVCNLAVCLHQDRHVESTVRPYASSILSVLSAPSFKDCAEEELNAFEALARQTFFRSKMVRRRCSVLAVIRRLFHKSVAIRSKALSILKMLSYQTIPRLRTIVGINFELMAEGMMDATRQERDTPQQVSLVHTLYDLAISVLGPEKVEEVIKALVQVAAQSSNSDAALAASLSAIQLARRVWTCQPILEHVLRFISSPFVVVREDALDLLVALAASQTERLLATNAINLMVQHLWGGSEQISENILDICKQLVVHPKVRKRLCQTAKFVPALVHRIDDTRAATILWSLIDTSDGLEYLLCQSSVRPWLTSLALHSSDVVFQQKIRAALYGERSCLQQQ